VVVELVVVLAHAEHKTCEEDISFGWHVVEFFFGAVHWSANVQDVIVVVVVVAAAVYGRSLKVARL